jgi:hypothetical protein
MRRTLFVAFSGVIAVLMAVSPAAADTPLAHTGNVGPHRLIDTWSKPGMACHLSQVAFNWWMLDRISVRPPKMRGTRDHQPVAWRFFVERSPIGTEVAIPYDWKVTFRSPRQSAVAHVHTPARFSRMDTPITVPKPHAHGDVYAYRVKVRMIWYRANGTVQGRATHLVDLRRQTAINDPDGQVDDATFPAPCWTSRPPTQ